MNIKYSSTSGGCAPRPPRLGSTTGRNPLLKILGTPLPLTTDCCFLTVSDSCAFAIAVSRVSFESSCNFSARFASEIPNNYAISYHSFTQFAIFAVFYKSVKCGDEIIYGFSRELLPLVKFGSFVDGVLAYDKISLL